MPAAVLGIHITASLVQGTTIRYLFSISVLCYFVTNAGLSVNQLEKLEAAEAA